MALALGAKWFLHCPKIISRQIFYKHIPLILKQHHPEWRAVAKVSSLGRGEGEGVVKTHQMRLSFVDLSSICWLKSILGVQCPHPLFDYGPAAWMETTNLDWPWLHLTLWGDGELGINSTLIKPWSASGFVLIEFSRMCTCTTIGVLKRAKI